MACYLLGVSYDPMLGFPAVSENGVCLSTLQSATELRAMPFMMPGTTQTRHLALREHMVRSLPNSASPPAFVEKAGSTERLQTPVFLHHVLPKRSDHLAFSTLCVRYRAPTPFSSPVLLTSSFVFEELGIAFISSFPPVHHWGV